jgi:hypothetical protein
VTAGALDIALPKLSPIGLMLANPLFWPSLALFDAVRPSQWINSYRGSGSFTLGQVGALVAPALIAPGSSGARVAEEGALALEKTTESALPEVTGTALEGFCFAAGTLVATCAAGEQPIEMLQVGDQVLSRNDETGVMECRPIVRTFKRTAHDLAAVTVADAHGNDETLHATLDHRFWLDGRGWTKLRDLSTGDAMWSPRGQPTVAVEARTEVGASSVYNIEVEEDHTYFVGRDLIWVHNACTASQMNAIRETGATGEARVRAVYDIGPKESFQINGLTRVPDGTTLTTLSEVKNVAYQAWTAQLRDYSQIAQRSGLKFNLYVRPGATLSSPLVDAEANGFVNIFHIP